MKPSFDNVHYMHMSVAEGFVTAAISIDDFDMIHVGLAFCSPRDQFSRAKGRRIATGRLVKNPSYILGHNPAVRVKALVRKVIQGSVLTKDDLFPQWATT
jgi:hypothetical protein